MKKSKTGKIRRDTMEKKELKKVLEKNLEVVTNLWRSL